jgi:hypothetical protein
MDDDLDPVLVEVRADTRAFAADIAAMRGSLDSGLVAGFDRAGAVLERGILSAVRRGSLSFTDLKDAAFQAIDQIAAHALKIGLDQLVGGGGGAGAGGLLGGALGALLGLPGRATGGDVAPHRPFIVGERGPELFVPTAAGRVEPSEGRGSGRRVNVAVQLNVPAGTDAPVALQRSSRQLASAVRRAFTAS